MCISAFDTAGSYSVQVVSQGPVYWLQVPLVGLVFKNNQPILTCPQDVQLRTSKNTALKLFQKRCRYAFVEQPFERKLILPEIIG